MAAEGSRWSEAEPKTGMLSSGGNSNWLGHEISTYSVTLYARSPHAVKMTYGR